MVIALLALVAGGTLVFAFSSVSRSSLLQERDFLVSMLHAQRGAALSNIEEAAHGLHIDATSYVLFKGITYNAADPSNRSVPHGTLTFSGPTDVVFAQLSGNVVAGAGTISLSSNGQTQTIDINSYGRIDW